MCSKLQPLTRPTCDGCDDDDLSEVGPPVPVLGGLGQDNDDSDKDEHVDHHHDHDGRHEEVHPPSVVQETTEMGRME